MVTTKKAPRKAAARRKSAGMKGGISLERLQDGFEKRLEDVQHQVEDLGKMTQEKAGQFALNLVEFQRTTFDNTAKTVFTLQDQTEKLLREAMKNSGVMPREGEKVVNEWIKMIHRTRTDFQRTMDLSFDLIGDLIKRMQKAEKESAAAKKAPAKKAPAKKKAAVKKAPAKKKAAAKKKAVATS